MKCIPVFFAPTRVLFGVVLIFLSGCYTPTVKVELEPVVEIYAGMPAAELVALLGKPDEVREPDAAGQGVEIWIYRAISQTLSREAANTPLDTVGTSYISATLKVVEEVEVDSFLLADGKVVAWKTKVKRRQY